MHIVGVLALILALVFGLVAFGYVIDLNVDIAALTSGGVQSFLTAVPAFWMLLVGAIAIGAVIVAVSNLFG